MARYNSIKSQLFGIDTVIAFGIFLGAMLLFYNYSTKAIDTQQKDLNIMLTEANRIADYLVPSYRPWDFGQWDDYAECDEETQSGYGTGTYACTPGMIAFYKFDEISAAAPWTTPDATGNDAVGAELHNGPVLEASEKVTGNSIYFDGADDYILIPNGYINVYAAPWYERTTSLWMYASQITDREVVYEEGGPGTGMNLYVNKEPDATFKLYGGQYNGNVPGWSGSWITVPISTGQWYHVVLMLTGADVTNQPDKLKMFINGQEVVSGEGAYLTGHGNPICVGSVCGATKFHDYTSITTDYNFRGYIDELAVWNMPLTGSDIYTIYESTKPSPDRDLGITYSSLTDGRRKIIKERVLRFNNTLSYEQRKAIFHTTYDYNITFESKLIVNGTGYGGAAEDGTVNKVGVGGITSIGKNYLDENPDDLVKVVRFGRYNSSIVKVVLHLW